MKLISRRMAVKIGVGLVAFVPAARALAGIRNGSPSNTVAAQPSASSTPAPLPASVPPPPAPGASLEVPNYGGGRVLAVGNGTILVDTANHGQVTFRLTAASGIWKGAYGSNMPIEVGDYVHARGTYNSAHTELVVEDIYANIVNLMGSISDIHTTGQGMNALVADRFVGNVAVEITASTAVAKDGTETQFNIGRVQLIDGQPVQVIGLQRKGLPVLATRIFI